MGEEYLYLQDESLSRRARLLTIFSLAISTSVLFSSLDDGVVKAAEHSFNYLAGISAFSLVSTSILGRLKENFPKNR